VTSGDGSGGGDRGNSSSIGSSNISTSTSSIGGGNDDVGEASASSIRPAKRTATIALAEKHKCSAEGCTKRAQGNTGKCIAHGIVRLCASVLF